MSCKSGWKYSSTTVVDPLARYNEADTVAALRAKGETGIPKYDPKLQIKGSYPLGFIGWLIGFPYIAGSKLFDAIDVGKEALVKIATYSDRKMREVWKEWEADKEKAKEIKIAKGKVESEVLHIISQHPETNFIEAMKQIGLNVSKIGSLYYLHALQGDLFKDIGGHYLLVEFVDNKGSIVSTDEFELTEAEKGEAQKVLTTIDWTVNNDAVKLVKQLNPKVGLVKPYFQIIYHEDAKKQDVDIAWYLRPISITWTDENTERINTFTVTCAYHPAFTKLTSSCQIVPLIGTHEDKMLSLGTFNLKKVKVNMAPGEMTVDILFTAVNYANPEANKTYTAEDIQKFPTYKDFLNAAATRFKLKLEVAEGVDILDKRATDLPYQKALTFLELLNRLCVLNNLIFYIRRGKIRIESSAYNRSSFTYRVNLSLAKSFTAEWEPHINYHTVQVYMFKPSLNLTKKTKQKKEDRMVQVTIKDDKDRYRDKLEIIPEGNVFVSVRDDIKTEKEAKRHARLLLERLNSSGLKGQLTLPNCIVFSGYDIEVIQDIKGDFKYTLDPIVFYIKRVVHTIGVNGWTADLELVERQMGRKEDELARVTKGKKILATWRANVEAFKEIAYSREEILAFLKEVIASYRQNSVDELDDNTPYEQLTWIEINENMVKKRTYSWSQAPLTYNKMEENLNRLKKAHAKTSEELKKLNSELAEMNERGFLAYQAEAFKRLYEVLIANKDLF